MGLTRKQLLAQLRTGRTLSQIAHAQEQQFLAKLSGRLDKLVQRNWDQIGARAPSLVGAARG